MQPTNGTFHEVSVNRLPLLNYVVELRVVVRLASTGLLFLDYRYWLASSGQLFFIIHSALSISGMFREASVNQYPLFNIVDRRVVVRLASTSPLFSILLIVKG